MLVKLHLLDLTRSYNPLVFRWGYTVVWWCRLDIHLHVQLVSTQIQLSNKEGMLSSSDPPLTLWKKQLGPPASGTLWIHWFWKHTGEGPGLRGCCLWRAGEWWPWHFLDFFSCATSRLMFITFSEIKYWIDCLDIWYQQIPLGVNLVINMNF